MIFDLKSYRSFGVAKVGNVFNKDELIELDSEVSRIVKDAINLPKGSYVNFADADQRVINSIHRLDEMGETLFKSYAGHASVVEIAEKILGEDPVLFSIQLFLKPAQKGLATPAHQDNAYWHLSGKGGITIWVALDFVDDSNGAVQFIPGSHLDGDVPHCKSESTPGSSRVIEDAYLIGRDWISFNLAPGECTVHGGHSIHRSGNNVSGRSRRALLFNFKSKDSTRDEDAFQKYNNDLESINGRV